MYFFFEQDFCLKILCKNPTIQSDNRQWICVNFAERQGYEPSLLYPSISIYNILTFEICYELVPKNYTAFYLVCLGLFCIHFGFKITLIF